MVVYTSCVRTSWHNAILSSDKQDITGLCKDLREGDTGERMAFNYTKQLTRDYEESHAGISTMLKHPMKLPTDTDIISEMRLGNRTSKYRSRYFYVSKNTIQWFQTGHMQSAVQRQHKY